MLLPKAFDHIQIYWSSLDLRRPCCYKVSDFGKKKETTQSSCAKVRKEKNGRCTQAHPQSLVVHTSSNFAHICPRSCQKLNHMVEFLLGDCSSCCYFIKYISESCIDFKKSGIEIRRCMRIKWMGVILCVYLFFFNPTKSLENQGKLKSYWNSKTMEEPSVLIVLRVGSRYIIFL